MRLEFIVDAGSSHTYARRQKRFGAERKIPIPFHHAKASFLSISTLLPNTKKKDRIIAI